MSKKSIFCILFIIIDICGLIMIFSEDDQFELIGAIIVAVLFIVSRFLKVRKDN